MSGDDQSQRVSDGGTGTSKSVDLSFEAVRDRLPTRPEYSFSVDTYTKYVLALSFALFVFFTIYLSLRYLTYNLTGSDFGSYVHMFATTLSGKGWLLQGKYIASHPYGSYWGGHFSLTLLAFLPIFALFPSPYTLIVIKSFVLAASVVVLWILARDRLESDKISLLVTFSYAFNPFLWSAWTFDFQEQILLPALLFGTYYAYANARQSRIWRVLFLPLLALALLTNEFVVILVGGFLLGTAVAAYRNDCLRERLPLLVGGAILTVAVHIFSGWVIAHFSTVSGIPPASIANPIQPIVGQGRSSIVELVTVLLTHPAVIFETLAADGFTKAVYFIMLFVPVLFLPLRDEITLGSLAPFFVFAWLFTGRPAYYMFSAHYPLYLLPFVYIGTIRVLARMEAKYSFTTDEATTATTDETATAESAFSFTTGETTTDESVSEGSSLNPIGTFLSRLFVVVIVLSAVGSGAVLADKHEPLSIPDEHDELLSKAFDVIPQNASLVTQNDLFPHVATRPNATYIPNAGTFNQYRKKYGLPKPEYIIYDTTTAWANVIRDEYGKKLGTLYGVYAHQDRIWIWKKGYHGQPTGITHEEPSLTDYGFDVYELKAGTRSDGQIVATNVPGKANIWFGPKTQLPPGTYAVTFRLKASRTKQSTGGPVARVDVTRSYFHTQLTSVSVGPTQGYENITLTFTLHKPQNQIEYRGFSAGDGGKVKLQSITVERLGPAWVIGSLDKLGVNKGKRKNGTIVGRNVTPGQTIWYGPYVTLPAGTYTVTYEINATGTDANPRDGPIVRLDVLVGSNHRQIAHKAVPPTDGTERVRLTFTLNRPRRLVEFRGLSATPNGTVKLKSVTINRTEPRKENDNE